MNRKQFSLRLPEALIDEIDRLAELETRDRTNYIEYVLTRHVERKKHGFGDDGSDAEEMIARLHDQIAKVGDEMTRRRLTLRVMGASLQLHDPVRTMAISMGMSTLSDIQDEVKSLLGPGDSVGDTSG